MAKKSFDPVEPTSHKYTVFSRIDSETCSSNIFFEEGRRSIAVAEVGCIEGFWVINRVFVREKYRSRNFGTIVLGELLYLLRSREFRAVYVTPGGYDFPIEIQEGFYRSMGFRKQRKNARSFAYGNYVKLL